MFKNIILIVIAFMFITLSAQVSFLEFTFQDTLEPSFGTGTFTNIGGTTYTYASGYPNAPIGENQAVNLAGYPASSANPETAGFSIAVSTAGYSDISLSWHQRNSNTGANRMRLKYTIDGETWLDFDATDENASNTNITVNPTQDRGFDNGMFIHNSGNDWFFRTADFTGMAGVDDNPDFAIRLVTAFPTGETSYVGCGGNYGSAGTTRFDNVIFTHGGQEEEPPFTMLVDWVDFESGDTADFGITTLTGANIEMMLFATNFDYDDPHTVTVNFDFEGPDADAFVVTEYGAPTVLTSITIDPMGLAVIVFNPTEQRDYSAKLLLTHIDTRDNRSYVFEINLVASATGVETPFNVLVWGMPFENGGIVNFGETALVTGTSRTLSIQHAYDEDDPHYVTVSLDLEGSSTFEVGFFEPFTGEFTPVSELTTSYGFSVPSIRFIPLEEITYTGKITITHVSTERDEPYVFIINLTGLGFVPPPGAPGATHSPSPVDEAADIAIDTSFAWELPMIGGMLGGEPFDTLTFYISTDIEDFDDGIMLNITDTSYTPATVLLYETEYFWKVVPRNGPTPPNFVMIWSFTTVEAPNLPLNPPRNLQAVQVATDAVLTWQEPEETAAIFEGYRVYRGENELTTTLLTELTFTDLNPAVGEHVYSVYAVYQTGISEPVSLTFDIVSENDETLPIIATELLGNYPNPFNPETAISFNLLNDGNVTLEIYNARGQRIRSLLNEFQKSGHYQIVWNGKDESGREAISGVYFYILKTEDIVQTRRMLMIK